jgi:Zn-dependent protease with chaperone function
MKRVSYSSRAVALFLVLLLAAMEPMLLVAATPKTTPQLPDPGEVRAISKEEQQQLGLKVMGEVYKQMPVLPDSHPVSQYVQSLGKRLAGVIPPENSWPFQFHVVQQKDINAFALPGGPIFVNLGTITAASNEAELAGVVGHEIAHVYMQHSAKAVEKQGLLQGLAGVLGSVLGGAIGGTAGALAQAGMSIGAGVVSMKYSRSDEAQADAVGAILLYKSNHNPVAMADFFRKLEQEGGGRGPQFLSDHPNPGNRVTAVSKQIQSWPSQKWQQSSQQFARAKQQAASTRAYSAEEVAQMAKTGQVPQGGAAPTPAGGSMGAVPRAQIMPSGSFKTLDAQAFNISYPDNWQAFGDQQSGGVTIAPQAGVTQGAVAYGVVINAFQPQSSQSLDQGVNELIGALRQSNPELRANGSPRRIRVAGVEGRSVDLTGPSPIEQNGRPVRERDWLVALPQQGSSLMFLVFVSPEQDFNQLRPTYEQMLRSLRLR